jgi:predicted RNase H-like HicB family nuclease
MTNNKERAKELAIRPYTVIVFLDETTDGGTMYVALNPELDHCIAQGETTKEAQENLDQFRIDYIEHLLNNNLPVPEPKTSATITTDVTLKVSPVKVETWDFENMLGQATQPEYRRQLLEASWKS